MSRQILALSAGIVILMTVAGCGYNKLQGLDEEVKSAWAEVLNQYQRRFDLIPNLVNTVKGYASHEKETLQGVVEARAEVQHRRERVDRVYRRQELERNEIRHGEDETGEEHEQKHEDAGNEKRLQSVSGRGRDQHA